MTDLTKLMHFPLWEAILCQDCNEVSNGRGRVCRACASINTLILVTVLDRLTKEEKPCHLNP